MKVLASRPLPGPAWEELEDVEYLAAPLPDGLGGFRPDVGGLAVVGERVDAASLDLLPELCVVANYGAGYDSIDVAECERRGVAVTNTPGVLDAAVADLTLALILAVRRRLVEADRMVRGRDWTDDWSHPYLVGDDLAGATLGVVGFGGIGRAVARRARAFDLRVIYTRRNRLAAKDEDALEVEYRSLDELFGEADIVTLHVPLTAETSGLVDARRLGLLRDGGCVVNTARGGVIDEPALIAELRSGRIRAALDVFATEPGAPTELIDLPNVVLTPHIGSATTATREAMTRLVVDNLLAAASAAPLVTPV